MPIFTKCVGALETSVPPSVLVEGGGSKSWGDTCNCLSLTCRQATDTAEFSVIHYLNNINSYDISYFFPQDVHQHMDEVPLNDKVSFSTNTIEKCCLRFLVFLRVRLNLVLLIGVMFLLVPCLSNSVNLW